MKISIVSINYFPEPTGISVYTTGMAEYLAACGHEITVFTAFAYYPAWKKVDSDKGRIFASETIAGVQVLRNYVYVPRAPTAIRRILHELSFTCSAGIRYLFNDPGVITIVVTPPLLLGTVIGLLAKPRSSRVLLHVQDLQPDAAIDLGMLKPGALTRLLYAIEKAGYALATRVSTISAAMRAKIASKGVAESKCLIFKNWANDELIHPIHPKDSLRNVFGLEDKFVVLYSGNMGVKQGLGMLLDAANLLSAVPEVMFLVAGDGGEKDSLMARAGQLGLENVRFIPPVPKDDLASLLATADVSVITQKAHLDDLVLPSKLANILASRRPIIASTKVGSELAAIVTEFECGLIVPPEDGAMLANALQRLLKDPGLRLKMAENGVAYARAYLGRDSILSQFVEDLQMLAPSA